MGWSSFNREHDSLLLACPFTIRLSVLGKSTQFELPGKFMKVSKFLTGSARRVVHGEIGCSNWKKTLAYLLVLPGSRARIVRCGGRYDPQLIKRSSE